MSEVKFASTAGAHTPFVEVCVIARWLYSPAAVQYPGAVHETAWKEPLEPLPAIPVTSAGTAGAQTPLVDV